MVPHTLTVAIVRHAVSSTSAHVAGLHINNANTRLVLIAAGALIAVNNTYARLVSSISIPVRIPNAPVVITAQIAVNALSALAAVGDVT